MNITDKAARTLAERIAAEHRWTLREFTAADGTTYNWPSCACGVRLGDDDSPAHELHVAEVTEAAVRDELARGLALRALETANAATGNPLDPSTTDTFALLWASRFVEGKP